MTPPVTQITPGEIAALNNMQNMLNAITERLAIVEASNVTLTGQLSALPTAVSSVPLMAAVPTEKISEPKIAAPKPFGGISTDLRSFLVQVELMFM